MKLKDVVLTEVKGQWGIELDDGEVGTPVIKTNNMTYEGYLDLTELTYRKLPESKIATSFLRHGDLLVEKSGGTKTHSVGYINVFEDANNKFVANNFILTLRINETKANPKYMFYQLKYKYESGLLDHLHNQTTGIQNLKVSLYFDQEIILHSLKEQNEIVKSLEKIERAIKIDKSIIVLLDSLVKSRFNEMFGNITNNDKNWDTQPLNSVCDVRDGTHDSPKYCQTGYPFITSKNITDGDIDFSNVQYISENDYLHFESRSHVDDGDILMPMIGTIGGAVIVKKSRKFSIKNVCLIKFTRSKKITNTFIKYLLNSNEMMAYYESQKKGGNQQFLSLNKIRNLRIIMPPLEFQNEFISFINNVDKLKFLYLPIALDAHLFSAISIY